MPFHPGEQQLFQVGLVEHVRLREAVLADLVLSPEFGHDVVPGVEQAHLAGVPVGAADGRRGTDRGMAQQRLLDHPGVDVVAAADDQVLGPAGQIDKAAGVHAAEVTGVQPAVTDDTLPAHPGAAGAGVGDVSRRTRRDRR